MVTSNEASLKSSFEDTILASKVRNNPSISEIPRCSIPNDTCECALSAVHVVWAKIPVLKKANRINENTFFMFEFNLGYLFILIVNVIEYRWMSHPASK